MALAKKSGKMQHEETLSRATQDEDHQTWMDDVPYGDTLDEENEVKRENLTNSFQPYIT